MVCCARDNGSIRTLLADLSEPVRPFIWLVDLSPAVKSDRWKLSPKPNTFEAVISRPQMRQVMDRAKGRPPHISWKRVHGERGVSAWRDDAGD